MQGVTLHSVLNLKDCGKQAGFLIACFLEQEAGVFIYRGMSLGFALPVLRVFSHEQSEPCGRKTLEKDTHK